MVVGVEEVCVVVGKSKREKKCVRWRQHKRSINETSTRPKWNRFRDKRRYVVTKLHVESSCQRAQLFYRAPLLKFAHAIASVERMLEA